MQNVKKFNKIIVWGYKSRYHTQGHVQKGWYDAFVHLGYETYWFDDLDYPSPDSFDYNNCLFLTEGFADKNIPIVNSSTYMVHVCVNPQKYLGRCKRLIDQRYNEVAHKDAVYDYEMNRKLTQRIGPCFYYEPNPEYDRIYVSWATNLLPHQIDLSWRFIPRTKTIYYLGTLNFGDSQYDSGKSFLPFLAECKKYDIEFRHNDPWTNPLTDQQVIELTQKSFMGIDIRGEAHLKHGYVPCRVFKNISYGQLGLTNSLHVYEELEGHVLYQPDVTQLFHEGMNQRLDYNSIRNQMMYIKDNHTFVNRAKNLLEIA